MQRGEDTKLPTLSLVFCCRSCLFLYTCLLRDYIGLMRSFPYVRRCGVGSILTVADASQGMNHRSQQLRVCFPQGLLDYHAAANGAFRRALGGVHGVYVRFPGGVVCDFRLTPPRLCPLVSTSLPRLLRWPVTCTSLFDTTVLVFCSKSCATKRDSGTRAA